MLLKFLFPMVYACSNAVKIIATGQEPVRISPFVPSLVYPVCSMMSSFSNWVKDDTATVYKQEDVDHVYRLILELTRDSGLAHSIHHFTMHYPFHANCCIFQNENTQTRWRDNKLSEAGSSILDSLVKLGFDGHFLTVARSGALWHEERLAHKGHPFEGPYLPLNDQAIYVHLLASLLLSYMSDLKSVGMLEVRESSPLHDFLLKINYGGLPRLPLQNVRHVELLLDEASPYFDDGTYCRFDLISNIRLFHRLPAIESISVRDIGYDPEGRTALPPGTSNLRNISIYNADISSSMLATVIRLPKALESFTVSIGDWETHDGGYSLMFPKTLGKALLGQKSSLRVLDVDVDEYLRPGMRAEEEDDSDPDAREHLEGEFKWQRDKYWKLDEAVSSGEPLLTKDLPDTRRYGTTIGSLQDFVALKQLRIGVNLLLGVEGKAPFSLVEALPPNLESLHVLRYVAGVNKEHDSQIRTLMERRHEFLPRLTNIVL